MGDFKRWLPQSDTCHFATPSEMTDSGKDPQQTPQPGGARLLGNRISRDSHSLWASCKEEIKLYNGAIWLSPGDQTASLIWDKQTPVSRVWAVQDASRQLWQVLARVAEVLPDQGFSTHL